MKIELEPIGYVRGGRTEVINDDWGDVKAAIEMDRRFPSDAIAGLESSYTLVL